MDPAIDFGARNATQQEVHPPPPPPHPRKGDLIVSNRGGGISGSETSPLLDESAPWRMLTSGHHASCSCANFSQPVVAPYASPKLYTAIV